MAPGRRICTNPVPKNPCLGDIPVAQDLLSIVFPLREERVMPQRKRQVKVATQQRDHQHLLWAILYLGGVVLLFNAWLVSQNLIGG
jgi:hypothetical protein